MRTLENDATLSHDMRQRVRLEIAELFYIREANTANDAVEVPPGTEPASRGLGEETLLQFITANPDSNLLESAFFRLKQRHALEKSTYVLSKLQEWSRDTTHPKRAGLALLSLLLRMQARGEDTAALANRAATELPAEPATRTILQEHIRDLQTRGLVDAARPYLTLLESIDQDPEQDARTLFLRAYDIQGTPRAAAALFMRCAQKSEPGKLKTAALVNALICSMLAGDRSAVENLLSEQNDSETRRALLLTHVRLLPDDSQKEQAATELREVLRLNPDRHQVVDVLLETARRQLKDNPQATLRELEKYTADQRAQWTDDQDLFYAALVEQATHLSFPDDNEPTHDVMQRLIEEAPSLPRHEALALHSAVRLSAAGQHAAARDVLLKLAEAQPPGRKKATTLLYAGRECERCDTLPALKHAATLYAECLRWETPLRPLAGILRAAVLTRINRADAALAQLSALDTASMPPDLFAHYNTVLADTLAHSGTPERVEEALGVCKRTIDNENIPLLWRMRTHLQRAILNLRLRRDADALQDYRAVLDAIPKNAGAISSAESSMFYDAAAGAVYRLLQLEHFAEAADLAEEAASWPGSKDHPNPADKNRADRFSQWAQVIRQVSFRPAE